MPDDPWGDCLLGLAVADSLDPIPANLRKALEHAENEGWEMSKTGCTLVLRLHRPADEVAIPFYVRWDLIDTGKPKRAWRFHSALAANGQRLTYNDIFEYLSDPTVIYPEPPSEDGNGNA